MVVHQDRISLRTSGHGDMHDITTAVTKIIDRSRITTGTVQIFNVGSTAAIGAIEFEPGLKQDRPQLLDRLVPPSPEGTQLQHSSLLLIAGHRTAASSNRPSNHGCRRLALDPGQNLAQRRAIG